MMNRFRTPLVVHEEDWPHKRDLVCRRQDPPTGTNPWTCKDCGQVLGRQSRLCTCECCKVAVCANHSGQGKIYARKELKSGRLVTLCTYCISTLKVTSRTVLTIKNTRANAKRVSPISSNPPSSAATSDTAAAPSTPPVSLARVGGGGTSTQSSPSPSPPRSPSLSGPTSSSSLATSLATSLSQPASAVMGHRKCHEAEWRDCFFSLFGGTRRNRPPPGQPSATPSPSTNSAGGAASTPHSVDTQLAGDEMEKLFPEHGGPKLEGWEGAGAMAPEECVGLPLEALFSQSVASSSVGEWEAGVAASAKDERSTEPDTGGATPPVAMSDTPARRCRRRRQRTVSWGGRTVDMFSYSEREEAGGDLEWIKESARSSRRKDESVSPKKPDEEQPTMTTTASPLPRKSSPGNPLSASDDVDRNSSGDPSSTQGTPASASKPDGDEDHSIGNAPTGSLLFPFPPTTDECDGWSSEAPKSGQAVVSAGKSGPTVTGEGDGEGESEERPPRASTSSRYFPSLPKVAGAVAVIGIAATVGVMVLRRRR